MSTYFGIAPKSAMVSEVDIKEKGVVIISSPGFVLPPEERGVGLVFQSYALFPHLTVKQNILFGLNDKTSGSVKTYQRFNEGIGYRRVM